MKKLTLALLISAAASQASAIQLQLESVEIQFWGKFVSDGGGATENGHTVVTAVDGSDPDDNIFGADVPYSASTATWSFDGSVLTGSGNYLSHWRIHPGNTLWDHSIDDLTIVMGGEASATAYQCIEGNFGAYVGANLCGNYELGSNFVDDSNMAYNVGGDAGNQVLTLGGDDTYSGLAQALSDYDNSTDDDDATYAGLSNAAGQLAMSAYSWDGSTLKIHNMTGGQTTTLTFSAVPVPAAAWLFGSALLGLVGVKRKQIKQ